MKGLYLRLRPERPGLHVGHLVHVRVDGEVQSLWPAIERHKRPFVGRSGRMRERSYWLAGLGCCAYRVCDPSCPPHLAVAVRTYRKARALLDEAVRLGLHDTGDGTLVVAYSR